jgi:hypothetical protein
MKAPRRAWPLLLVAGGAFLPGLGFLFAAVALAWSLLSDQPRARWAAGLAALGAGLNLVAAGLLLWYLHGNPNFAAALQTSVRQDLLNVVQALEDYRAQWQEYPRELSALTEGGLALRPST